MKLPDLINPRKDCEKTKKNLPKSSVSNNFNVRVSENALLEGIRNKDNNVLESIYDQCFPMIQDLVVKNSGDQDDAWDIFQDAMVAIYDKVRKNELVLFCSFKTYLFAVCKRLMLKHLMQKKKVAVQFVEEPCEAENTVEYGMNVYEEEVEKYNIFQHHFLGLKEDARKLLQLYMEDYSFKEISSLMGYKSESYAKTRKFAVKEELKRRVLEDPYYKKIYEVCA